MTPPLLEVRDLEVRYGGNVAALRGVDLTLERGSSLAVTGESGAGKSTLAHTLIGLVRRPEVTDGSIRISGREVVGAEDEELRRLRWETVAIALQGAPFNPVVRVGAQLLEPLRDRGRLDAVARSRVEALARELGVTADALERYPHELSGGERQRAAVAMALVLDPELVVLDEPGLGLDPASRLELVETIARLADERSFALLVISHELPAIATLARRTIVLYAGEVVEEGETAAVLATPEHPYTWGLVNAYPVMSTAKDLRPIRGLPPDARALPSGCAFHPRCTQSAEICSDEHPALEPSRGRLVRCHFGGLRTALEARGLRKRYRGRDMPALDDVSIALRHGESLGVVGPSGSGKTTLARILAGDLEPDEGELLLGDEPLRIGWRRTDRERGRRVQLVQQDPRDALSPRLSVEALVGEPLQIMGTSDRDAVARTLLAVGLPQTAEFLRARANELSGGELQRVALARALLAEPEVLVADEPTSMLDASEQARLLVNLRDLQIELGLALVLVSHDLALVRKMTDRVVVLVGGRVIETGSSASVTTAPQSVAGQALVATAPAFDLRTR